MKVSEFIERAAQYSSSSIEGKRRSLILLVLKPALRAGDISLGDDMEEAVGKLCKTFVQLGNLWAAVKKEKPE